MNCFQQFVAIQEYPRGPRLRPALDEVRRELHREGTDLKGAMWSHRGNA